MDWFDKDHQHWLEGYNLSLRARVALDIIKHCAMVVAVNDGEDSAGRSRLRLSAPSETAQRANDIADALVAGWEAQGWIRKVDVTPEEAAIEAGRLERVKSREAYKTVREELTGQKDK
jgi:hypothetical protein